MIKHIDLFMPPRNYYDVLSFFTKSIGDALQRAGVHCRLLEAQRDNPGPFVDALFENPPDCTFSLNGLLPDDQGRFFCDIIQIPHVAYLIDSATHFLSLAASSRTIVAASDKTISEVFRSMRSSHAFFLPLGVDKTLVERSWTKEEIKQEEQAKRYDIVMLSSFIDYEEIRHHWREKLAPPLCKALEEAGERVLSEPTLSYVHAFTEALNDQLGKPGGVDPSKIDLTLLLDELEYYINGKDRVEMLKTLKGMDIHIFGTASKNWKKYIGNNGPNIIIHDPVSYNQGLDIMRQSKIVLSCHASIKEGAHERVLSGFACGALVVANNNHYLQENFKDGQNIALYKYKKWDEMGERIREYLGDVSKRYKIVSKGREALHKHHTWDNRVEALLKELDPILQAMPKKT